MLRFLLVAVLGVPAAALHAEPVEGPRYVYAVWTCTESYQGDWHCSAPPAATEYASLDDCQAARRRYLPQPRELRQGITWYMCWRKPTWEPAEPSPRAAVDGGR